MNTFVFDIETIPDTEVGRNINGLSQTLSDHDVAEALFALRKAETEADNPILPHYCHRIVAISAVFRHHDKLAVWSLGNEDASEKELIQRFFDGIKHHAPTLVSWNGSGFDLPVLHYRALHHHIIAPLYWETGHHHPQFRYDNYLNRYHTRHTDLMEILAGFNPRAYASLNNIAVLLGFPGKMGGDGAHVWEDYQAGKIQAIRNYCETDVLNTYLIYLRFEQMRGLLTAQQYEDECQCLKETLAHKHKPHWDAFLSAWEAREANSDDVTTKNRRLFKSN